MEAEREAVRARRINAFMREDTGKREEEGEEEERRGAGREGDLKRKRCTLTT